MTNRPKQRPIEGGTGRLPFGAAQNEAVRIVCAALGLACVVLALRIASIW